MSITQDKLRLCPPRARRRLVFNAPSWEFTECKKNHPSVDSNPSYYPSEQFRQGFLGSLLVVLRLRENAVLHGGPPCSSFVFINSFTHGRTKSSPLGKFRLRGYVRAANTSHGSIIKKGFTSMIVVFMHFWNWFLQEVVHVTWHRGNKPRITSPLCILLLLATVRCCWVILEQPRSSIMPWFPYLVFVQKAVRRFIGWQWCSLCWPQL